MLNAAESTPTDGFPGGHARLPRISNPRRTPPPTASAGRPAAQQEQSTRACGFADYFSVESLFEHGAGDHQGAVDPDDPYAVLGVNRDASWKEISREHRKLVARLHPDRFIDADDATRAEAERKVRDVNAAFADIRKQRGIGR
jgi:DnaJ-domain-containing protein 1